MIGRAFALGFHQHWQTEIVVAVPGRERLEQLQPLTSW